MKALLIKEFRENLKWLAVGLVVFSFVAYSWLPAVRFSSPYTFRSQIDNGLSAVVGLLGGLFAFAIGVLQSAFDLRPGPRAYLEHRGVKSSQIVIAKLITGFTVYSASIVIPLSFLAVYLARVGIQSIPVRPAQVFPSIVAAFFAFILHPIAIFCLARCASWWGTKTVPIISAIAIAGPSFGFFSLLVFSTNLWIWLLPAYVVLLAIVCWAAIDGWQKLSLNPPAGQASPNGWRVNGVLILGSLVCTLIAIQFLSPIASSFRVAERRDYDLKFDLLTGEPWAVSIRPEDLLKSNLTENKASIYGCKVEFGVEPKEYQLLPKKLPLQQMHGNMAEYVETGMFKSTRYDQVYHNMNPLWTSVIDARGYLLRYSVVDARHPILDAIIDRDGVHPPKSLPGKPFRNLREISGSLKSLRAFYDDNGVYVLRQHRSNASEMQLYTLVDGSVLGAYQSDIHHAEKNRIQRLIVVVDGEIREYRLLDKDNSEEWTHGIGKEGDDGEWIENRVGEFQEIRAELFKSIAIPKSIIRNDFYSLLRTQAGYVVQLSSFNRKHFLLGFDGTVTELPTPSNFMVTEGFGDPVSALVPPVVGVPALLSHYIYRAKRGESTELVQWILEKKSMFLTLAGISVIFVGLSMWVVNRMLRKRGISGKLRMAWLAACIAFGVATPLIVACIYAVRVREKCPACGKPRRIDLAACEACGESWPKNDLHGIEVYDHEKNPIPVGV